MKVDFHVHVEEGPYSLNWLQHTAKSLADTVSGDEPGGRAWMDGVVKKIKERIQEGPYSTAWLDLYRERAKQRGIRIVGVVEHGYRFVECRPLYERQLRESPGQLGRKQQLWLDQVCCERLDEYVRFLEAQRNRWEEDGISLRVGIELDFFPGEEEALNQVATAYDWDFCMGAVHFVEGIAVHLPETREYIRRMPLESLYSRYFDLVELAAGSGLFDLIAHLDGVKACGYRPEEASLLSTYQRVARSLGRFQVATEINTAGYRSLAPIQEMSPSYRLLEILAQHAVTVVPSSGAVYPEQLGKSCEEAYKLLKRAGFASFSVFEQRKQQIYPLV